MRNEDKSHIKFYYLFLALFLHTSTQLKYNKCMLGLEKPQEQEEGKVIPKHREGGDSPLNSQT